MLYIRVVFTISKLQMSPIIVISKRQIQFKIGVKLTNKFTLHYNLQYIKNCFANHFVD